MRIRLSWSSRFSLAAFLLILLFLLGSVMHQALGQGNTGKRSVAANLSQAAPPSTDGAVIGTYAPAQPAPNIVAPAEPSQATSTWTVATPYPTTICRYGFAQTATHFYVFGGVSDGTRVNGVNRMDIATGAWQSRAAMPFSSEAPACALMASTGIVYCTEGDTGSGFASYNIATDTWTPLASIPGGDHYGSASGAFNGKVFVAGGTTGFTNAVQVYDVASNTWGPPGTAAPNDFLLAGYQQVGQYLYVAGGFEAGGPNPAAREQSSVLRKGLPNQPAVPSANNATTLRLDMSSAPGVWSTGPAFTPGRADFGLAYDTGTNKLYALGGDVTGGGFFDSTNLVDELSVGSWPGGSWVTSPDNLILPNRSANQAGFYGAGQIWSVGGLVGQTFQFLFEVQSRANGCIVAWQNEPPIANVRRNPATVVVGSNLYAITGFNSAPNYTAVNERFDGISWTTLAPIPVPHAQSRGTAVGTNVYVPGGFNSISFGGPLDTMQIYNTTANTWSAGMTLPAARAGVATATFNGLVYVIGGYNPTGTGHNEVYIYNPGTNSYSTGAPMTATQGNAAGVLFNGEIYVIGGGTAPGAQYAYNPTTNMWRTIPALPTTGGTCQSDNGFVLNNELWVVGCLGLAINQQVWIYNPGSDTWRAGPPYTVDHQGPGAALFNGRGFAVGGGSASGGSTAVESVGGCAAAPCQFRVLIAYADTSGPPTTLQNQILAEPGVTAVDLFDAFSGTPTLAQLEQYDIVVAFSNTAYSDAVAMGNVLADYADTGGVVVGLNFDWFGAPFGLAGRWMTGGYTPFNSPGPTHFATSCLGTYNTSHPLMQGFSAGSLCAFFRHTLTLSPGAVSVAMYQDNEQLCAYKTNNGHTGVGINAYLGSNPENFSGPFGRVIVNAGRWLSGNCAPLPSSAVSRKVHGATPFDIPLPLSGTPGIECRGPGGGTNPYQVVVSFANAIASVNGHGVPVPADATLTAAPGPVVGAISAITISGSAVIVDLTGVGTKQRLTLTLLNVFDGVGNGNVVVPMNVLIGDSAGVGNGSVNSGDISFVKSKSGAAAIDASNFRADVATNGSINSSDVGLVKSKSGDSLP